MTAPRIGELFAGYGGLGMAVQQVYGGDLAWYSEFDDAPSRIMAHHHPGVPNYGDVTAIDWGEIPRVDILTGGFPCQDVSVAGRRAGMTDGTRSGLWSHMAHAIGVLRPQLVVIENVGGLFSAEATSVVESHPWCLGDGGTGSDTVLLRALDAVLSTLSELGYDAEWTALRASDVGAPHGRLRVFITAHPQGEQGSLEHGDGRSTAHPSGSRGGRWTTLPLAGGEGGADAPTLRADDRPDASGDAPRLMPTPRAADGMGHPLRSHATDTSRLEDAVAVNLLPTPTAQPEAIGDPEVRAARVERARAKHGRPFGESLSSAVGQLLPTPSTLDSIEARTTYGGGNPTLQGAVGGVSDVDAARHERAGRLLPTPVSQPSGNTPEEHLRKKPGRDVVTDLSIIAENGLFATGGRLLPTPVVTDSFGARNETSGRQPDSQHHSGRTLGDVVWLGAWGEYGPAIARWEHIVGRPAPAPTEPGKNRPRLSSRFVEWLMGLDDGHVTGVGLTRNQELKALGNGVVPQQGAAALRHLDQIRRTS